MIKKIIFFAAFTYATQSFAFIHGGLYGTNRSKVANQNIRFGLSLMLDPVPLVPLFVGLRLEDQQIWEKTLEISLRLTMIPIVTPYVTYGHRLDKNGSSPFRLGVLKKVFPFCELFGEVSFRESNQTDFALGFEVGV